METYNPKHFILQYYSYSAVILKKNPKQIKTKIFLSSTNSLIKLLKQFSILIGKEGKSTNRLLSLWVSFTFYFFRSKNKVQIYLWGFICTHNSHISIVVENVLDYVAFHNHEIWQSENFILVFTLSWSQSGSVNTFQNETF